MGGVMKKESNFNPCCKNKPPAPPAPPPTRFICEDIFYKHKKSVPEIETLKNKYKHKKDRAMAFLHKNCQAPDDFLKQAIRESDCSQFALDVLEELKSLINIR